MSELIIIQKNQLDALADSVPDKTSLQRELKTQYDVDPDGIFNFITLFIKSQENPPFCIKGITSLDWEALCAVSDSLEEDPSNEDMSDAEKDIIVNRIFITLHSDLVALAKASAANAVAQESLRHLPILPFGELEPDESENLTLLLQEARDKANHQELSAFQLFIEGKLDKLLTDNPRLAAFNRLPEHKKQHARRQIIENMKWEDYYTA